MKQIIDKTLALAIILFSLAMIFYLIFFQYRSIDFFYVALWSISILTAVLILHGNHGKFTWLLVFIFVFVAFRAIVPFSTSPDVLSQNPDMNYQSQLVQMITKNGHLSSNTNDYSGQAINISGYPGLEIILSVLAKITALDVTLLSKYFALGLIIPTLLFVFCFYKRTMGAKQNSQTFVLSVLLFLSCPWIIGFMSGTVHLTLSFPLFILALAVYLPNRKSTITFVMLLLLITVTHHFMGLMLIVFIGIYLVIRYILKSHKYTLPKRQLTLIHLLFVSTIVIGWLFIMAPQTATYVVDFISNMLKPILTGHFDIQGARFATPGVAGKPFWMLVVQTVGYASMLGFGIFGLMLFLWKNVHKNKQSFKADLLVLSGLLLTGALLAIPFWLSPGSGQDLMWRSLLFIFLALSPFTARIFISINNNFKKSKRLLFRYFGLVLVIITLSSVIQNAVYSGVPFNLYSPSGSVQPEDPRLNLSQWISLAAFTRSYIHQDYFYGVRLAYNIVGSLATKNIIQVASDPVVAGNWVVDPQTLSEGNFSRNEIIMLRNSIVKVPDTKNYSLSQEQFDATMNNYDVIFQSQDAVVLISTGP